MPIPMPMNGEGKDEFMDKCMADPMMMEDYPDNDQKYAVCMQAWEDDQEDEEMSMNIEEVKSQLGKRENRNFVFKELRVIRGDEKPPKIQGHAAVFNKIVDIGWGFREQILPGAFKNALKNSDVRALFNHNEDYVLGRNISKTLTMKEDKEGLAVDISPPETQLIRDLVLTPMERGDINQMSFGFSIKKEQWEEEKGKSPTRSIVEIDTLFDVSIVTFPAYPTTDASVRSILNKAGIDFESLSCLMVRAQRGFELRSSDLEMIKTTIEVLNKLLPVPPDGANGGKDLTNNDAERKLSLFRKRLEVASKR